MVLTRLDHLWVPSATAPTTVWALKVFVAIAGSGAVIATPARWSTQLDSKEPNSDGEKVRTTRRAVPSEELTATLGIHPTSFFSQDGEESIFFLVLLSKYLGFESRALWCILKELSLLPSATVFTDEEAKVL